VKNFYKIQRPNMGFAKIMASVLWLNYLNPEDRGNMYLRNLVFDTTTRYHYPGDYRRNIPYSSEILWKFLQCKKLCAVQIEMKEIVNNFVIIGNIDTIYIITLTDW
jgi:hypothetical protein